MCESERERKCCLCPHSYKYAQSRDMSTLFSEYVSLEEWNVSSGRGQLAASDSTVSDPISLTLPPHQCAPQLSYGTRRCNFLTCFELTYTRHARTCISHSDVFVVIRYGSERPVLSAQCDVTRKRHSSSSHTHSSLSSSVHRRQSNTRSTVTVAETHDDDRRFSCVCICLMYVCSRVAFGCMRRVPSGVLSISVCLWICVIVKLAYVCVVCLFFSH